jgi:hypothetical protein
MIRRLFLLSVAILMTAFSVNGQPFSKGMNVWNMNLSYDFALKSGNLGGFRFQPEYGHYFTDQCYVGLGTGCSVNEKFKSWSIPIFLRAEFNLAASGELIPFVSMQAGYDISCSSNPGNGRINPAVGVKIPWTDNTMLNLAFGYTRSISNGSGDDFLGVKAGVTFGASAAGNFFRRFNYGIEVETYTSVKSEDEWGNVSKYSSIYGFRYIMLYPVSSRFDMGVTLGLGRYKDYYGRGGDATMTIRAKYKATQYALTENIYPFAQLDYGLAPWFYGYSPDKVKFAPALGLSYKISEKRSVDLTFGYSSLLVDGDSWKGSLRMALGYSF